MLRKGQIVKGLTEKEAETGGGDWRLWLFGNNNCQTIVSLCFAENGVKSTRVIEQAGRDAWPGYSGYRSEQ